MERIGKYQIKELVARGGMGELYLARDPDLDREVAVKVMSDDIMGDEKSRARFYREAKAAARLQHRNIVTVYDFAHDGEIPYIVMEFLRGQSLAERLRKGPPIGLQAKLDLGIQLCEGLHFAHGEGVIHRDVKPGNIWLLADGGLKLLDFGIAKSATGTLTHGSAVVGSAAYMSPEQIEGQPGDARSDVFSVGAVLFELITGERAFDGQSVTAVMMKITQDEPAADMRTIAPETPASLASIIAHALQKSPDDRYGDAAEMAADLRLARLEIAEQEERAATTIVKRREPEPPNARGQPSLDDIPTQPASAVQTPVHPALKSAPASVRPLDVDEPTVLDSPSDYTLRLPEDIEPQPVSPVYPNRPGSQRWAFVVGVVSIAALAGFVLVVKPEFLFGGREPPRLRVTSSPAGADVVVDGVDTGLQTPAELRFARLPADVRLELTGYEPFVTRISEQQLANGIESPINATLVELPPASPPPAVPPPVEPPPPVVAAPPPTPLAQLKVLRAPGMYAFCSASVGRGWKGHPFDGITDIKLPARSYSISIECEGQPPVDGVIQVPPGKTERNFNEVVRLR